MPNREEFEWTEEELNSLTQFMMEQKFGNFRSLAIAASWIGTMMGKQVQLGVAPRKEAEQLLKALVTLTETSFKIACDRT